MVSLHGFSVLSVLTVSILLLGNSLQVEAVALGGTCSIDDDCTADDANSVCDNLVCTCDPAYVESTGTCVLAAPTQLGDPCTDNTECQSIDANSICDGTPVCSCNTGYVEQTGACVAAPTQLGDACSTTADCTGIDANSICDGSSLCACNTGYVEQTGACVADSSSPTTCPQPSSPSNNAVIDCASGTAGSNNPANDGETCTYICNQGFFGSGSLTCDGTTGLFDAPTCQAITCSALSAPANGNAPTCTNDNNYGSVCTFTCMDGYSVTGSTSSTCGDGDGTSATGSFSGTPPTCEVGCTETCDANAVCTGDDSTVFICACNVGYTGNGTVCSATGGAVGMNNSSFSIFLPAFLMVLSAIFLC